MERNHVNRRIMLSLFRIWSVALYEMKALLRSMVFRVYLAFTLPVIAASAYVYLVPREFYWWYRAIPDAIPYRVLMLMGLVQAVFTVLAAALALDERKMDTAHMLHARPVSNIEYLLGKLGGVFLSVMGVNTLLLLVILLMNMVFMDVPVASKAYLLYPLLVSIPALVFTTGFVFLLALVIRNYAFVVTLAEGCMVALILFFGYGLHNLADPLAYRLPLMRSDFIGFGNIAALLTHRGMYLLLGLGFALAAALRFDRPPQSRKATRIAFLGALLCMGGAVFMGYLYLSPIKNGQALRSSMREMNLRTAAEPRATVERLRLEVKHRGREIEVTAHMALRNDTNTPIRKYIFSLNPGLRISAVSGPASGLPFSRKLHLVTVVPSAPLAPGGADSLALQYRGSIDERACYADVDERLRQNINRRGFFVYDKRHAFITRDYVLLTPETYWYPRAGIPRGSVFPQSMGQDLMDVQLTVEIREGLTVLSQGQPEKTGNGKFRFRPEVPLPGITLVIGNYEKRSITVEGREYAILLRPGHDYFSHDLNALSWEDVGDIVRDTMRECEFPIMGRYPYPRFTIVEVPVQFLSYDRFWVLARETLQPEMVLFPEKGALYSNFTPYYQSKTQTPKEAESNSFRNYIKYMFR